MAARLPQAADGKELPLSTVETIGVPPPPEPAPGDRRKKVAVHLLKAAIGAAIVGYLLYRYDFAAVWSNLREANAWLFVLAWAYGLAAMALYARMTRMAMRSLGMPLTTLEILKIQFQVRFYSLFMPGAANMLVKWYKFAKPGKQPAQALIIMGFTRLLHLIAIMLLATVGIWRDAFFPWPPLQWAAIGAAMALTLGFLFMVSTPGRHTATILADLPWIERFAPAFLATRWRKLWRILAQLQGISAWEIVLLLAMALGGNFLETLQHLAIGQAVGLELSMWVYAWLRGVLLLAAIVPFSFSGLGLREAGVVGLLVYYAVPEEQALAYSLLYFGLFVLGKGIVGGVLELIDSLRGGAPASPPPTQGT